LLRGRAGSGTALGQAAGTLLLIGVDPFIARLARDLIMFTAFGDREGVAQVIGAELEFSDP
jgi:hypothetical protein